MRTDKVEAQRKWFNVQIKRKRKKRIPTAARKLFSIFINYGQLEFSELEPRKTTNDDDDDKNRKSGSGDENVDSDGKKIKELVASCAFNINKLYKLKVNIRRLDIILSLIVLAERIGSMWITRTHFTMVCVRFVLSVQRATFYGSFHVVTANYSIADV